MGVSTSPRNPFCATLADLLTDDAVGLTLVSCFGSSGIGGGGHCKSEHLGYEMSAGVFRGVGAQRACE